MRGRAVRRAERYGFKARGAAQMFVDFAVLLGHEFDRDPMLYWIRDILTHSDGLDEATQAARGSPARRQVVEPSSMTMTRTSLVHHTNARPDCGSLARPYLHPVSSCWMRGEREALVRAGARKGSEA